MTMTEVVPVDMAMTGPIPVTMVSPGPKSKTTTANFSELADAARMYKLMAQKVVEAAILGNVTESMLRAFTLTSSNLDNILERAPTRVSVRIEVNNG